MSELFSKIPVIVYDNALTDKFRIKSELKNKAGIYMWTHLKSNRVYVGSAFDLSIRLSQYYYDTYLDILDNYISRALLEHTHEAFSLTILEIIEISDKSIEEARELILSREQVYLNIIFSDDEPNTYNLLKMAGSSLGYPHSEETKAKMSLIKIGENNPMFGKLGENHPVSKSVFVYSIYSDSKELVLYKSFHSCKEAAKFLDCSTRSLSRYLDKNKLYKKEWLLFSSEQK